MWEELIHALENPRQTVDIGFVGKYVDLTESYKSLIESLNHAGMHTESKVKIHYIDRGHRARRLRRAGRDMDAILVPGGFGKRGTEGKIAAIRYARENKVPYLGICLGMPARGGRIRPRRRRHRTARARPPFERDTKYPVIGLITDGRTAAARSRSVPRSPTSAARCASVARSAS